MLEEEVRQIISLFKQKVVFNNCEYLPVFAQPEFPVMPYHFTERLGMLTLAPESYHVPGE